MRFGDSPKLYRPLQLKLLQFSLLMKHLTGIKKFENE